MAGGWGGGVGGVIVSHILFLHLPTIRIFTTEIVLIVAVSSNPVWYPSR